MNIIAKLIDFILHIDKYLGTLISLFGGWTYGILFLIIFLETGLVLTPFLPGDSLLFGIGAFAAKGYLNLWLILILLMAAAILGDTMNYWIGSHVGKMLIEKTKFVKKEHLERTEKFYDKHGKKTIILARFVPIVRTFAPFVAGMGKMRYPTFLFYNAIGGIIWVGLFVLGGFYFGNILFVQEHFGLFIIGIIVTSFIPFLWEIGKHFIKRKK